MATSFLLKMQLIVFVNRRSSELSLALVEGAISVFEEFLVPGVVFVGELSEKVTQILVGVVFPDFPFGIFEIELIDWS